MQTTPLHAARPFPLRALALPALVLLALVLAGAACAEETPAFPACGAPFGDVTGPEDFELDLVSPAAPRILASGTERRQRGGPGAIVAIPLASDGAPAGAGHTLASELVGCPLRPHGVSLARSADGTQRLYAVHHAMAADDGTGGCRLPRDPAGEPVLHAIVIWRLEGDALALEDVLADPLLASPNDLYALSDGTLYVTNELTHRGALAAFGEVTGLSTVSDVVHFDPRRSDAPWRRVASGMRFANSVLASDDRLYVAASLDRSIHVYRRDAVTGELPEELAPIEIGTIVDNLLWEAPPTRFVVAAHGALLPFLRHARDASVPAPWEAWRIDVSGATPVRTLLARVPGGGPGGDAAATAAVHAGALYAGQVFERGLVRCIPAS